IAPIVTRVIASQNAARTRRLLITTSTEPITSNALRMMKAMNSQSTSTASDQESDALRGLHGTHPMTRKAAATRIARREYGISRSHPMFRIGSMRTWGTDHESPATNAESKHARRTND